MAPYNPEVKPTNDPKYGDFRPISTPEQIKPQGVETNRIMPEGVKQGDLSAQYEGQAKAYGYQAEGAEQAGFGKLFENVTGVLDFVGKAGVALVKKDIEDRVYSVAERERLAYTEALEKIKSGVGVKNILDANAQMTDDADTPDEVANLGGTLEGLSAARDSGKISGTYYASRLLAEAKDLRARYPGFRQEIDDQFAKVTGMNPANAYIRALVGDINKAASANATQKSKTLTWIRNNYLGHPLGEKTMQEYQAGAIDDNEVYRRFAPNERMKFEINERNLKFQDGNNTRADKARLAGGNIDYTVGATVAQASDALLARIGISSEADATRIENMTKSGAITAQQWNQWGAEINATIRQLEVQLPRDADEYGYTAAAGGKGEVNKRIKEGLAPLYALRDSVFARDTGSLYNAAREAKAIGDQDTTDLLKDSIVGPFYRQVQTMKNIGGEQYMKELNLDAIKTGISDKYRSYYNRWTTGIATQTVNKPGGQWVTFTDFVDEVKRKGVADPKLNNAVINQITAISNPGVSDEIKKNVARAAFSEGNYGFIDKLTDPKGNPSVSSQTAVFQRFTSPEITKEMFRLGQQDPKIWEDYQNWTKHTLTNNLMQREIESLAQVRDPSIRVGWDAENKRFEATYQTRYAPDVNAATGRPTGTVSPTGRPETNSEFSNVQRIVNRINGNLNNFKNVAIAAKQDVDRFVLGTIAESNPEALKDINGIPYQMLRDIGIANLKNNQKGIGSK